MPFNYLHPEKKDKEILCNKQRAQRLISTKNLPKDKVSKILDIASGRGHFYFVLKKGDQIRNDVKC